MWAEPHLTSSADLSQCLPLLLEANSLFLGIPVPSPSVHQPALITEQFSPTAQGKSYASSSGFCFL